MARSLAPVRARVGLIIPAVNTLTEPQFHDYLPLGVEPHFTRLRMTGEHHVPLPALLPRIVEAAHGLADAGCNLIVFHCTGSSMEAGLAAERQVAEAIRQATGRRATTVASCLLDAFRALQARRLVLVSPYRQSTNDHEIAFLAEAGIEVVHDRAMNLPSGELYATLPPEFWVQVTLEAADPRADAYFLSCTNIKSLSVIEELEGRLQRPVVASSQATIWYCLRTLELPDEVSGLGQLLRLGLPLAAWA